MTLQAGDGSDRPRPGEGISPESYTFLQELCLPGVGDRARRRQALPARGAPAADPEEGAARDDRRHLRAGCRAGNPGPEAARRRGDDHATRRCSSAIPAVYDALQDHHHPGAHEGSGQTPSALRSGRRPPRPGQEAYSLAMLLLEMGLVAQGWNIQILGTDLSTQILDARRQGAIMQIEVNRGLPAPVPRPLLQQAGPRVAAQGQRPIDGRRSSSSTCDRISRRSARSTSSSAATCSSTSTCPRRRRSWQGCEASSATTGASCSGVPRRS